MENEIDKQLASLSVEQIKNINDVKSTMEGIAERQTLTDARIEEISQQASKVHEELEEDRKKAIINSGSERHGNAYEAISKHLASEFHAPDTVGRQIALRDISLTSGIFAEHVEEIIRDSAEINLPWIEKFKKYPVSGDTLYVPKGSVGTVPMDPAVSTLSAASISQATDAIKDFKLTMPFADSASEDAIAAVFPFFMEEALYSGRIMFANMMINGDTTGTHQDDNVSTSTDYRALQKGARKWAIENSITADLSTMSDANMIALRGKMGIYGTDVEHMIQLLNTKAYFDIMGSLANLQTKDKAGEQATLFTGVIVQYAGAPVYIVPTTVLADANLSGVVGASGNDYGSIVIMNTRMMGIGSRSNLIIKRVEGNFNYTFAFRYRQGFHAAVTDGTAALGYKIS